MTTTYTVCRLTGSRRTDGSPEIASTLSNHRSAKAAHAARAKACGDGTPYHDSEIAVIGEDGRIVHAAD